MTILCLAVALAVAAGCGVALSQDKPAPDPKIEAAKGVLEKLAKLGNAFDPAVADLYADDARIHNTRRYPDGTVRNISVPAPQYKDLLRKAMPLAKLRGDTDSFTNTTYTVEGDGVRIKTIRQSDMKNYSAPYVLLVSPAADGKWLIREELSESRP